MEEFKGTRGEWKNTNKVKTSKGYLKISITSVRDGEEKEVICGMHWDYSDPENDTAKAQANAQLIAAAPELLKELEKAKNTLINCISELPESYKEAVRNVVKSNKSAINKAFGK